MRFYLDVFAYTSRYGYDPPEPPLDDASRTVQREAALKILEAQHASTSGISETTRDRLRRDIDEATPQTLSGSAFSKAKGEAIAALARTHLRDFVEAQESKFNVAEGGEGAARPARSTASAVSEEIKTHFAQDSKSLLRELGQAPPQEERRARAESLLLARQLAEAATRSPGPKRTDSFLGRISFVRRKTDMPRPAEGVVAETTDEDR